MRRLRMEPGEAMRWQVDPLHRVTVVLHGEALEPQYGGDAEKVQVIVLTHSVKDRAWTADAQRPILIGADG